MRINNYKMIAVFIVIVIVASIFLFASYGNDINKQAVINYYPSVENLFEEEYFNQSDGEQYFKSNKNIMTSLNIEFILFSIFNNADILKVKHYDFINSLFKFLNYSVFIVVFLNKKDGKKRRVY